MSSSLYSDNQNDVDALARRIAALTSLSSKQAAVISRGLLGRKVLKIKSSSLGGLSARSIRISIPSVYAMSSSSRGLSSASMRPVSTGALPSIRFAQRFPSLLLLMAPRI